VRRKEEDKKRYLQQVVQQLRDLISDKEEAYKVLAEQNIALVREIRAKEDKIALLQSDMNETRDLRTLVQEHDVIVERFRAQVLGLQTENSRLKFAGDQMKVEVNKIGDELRLQVMNLQQSEDAGRQKQSKAEVEAERRIEMCKRVVQRMMRYQLLVAWNMFRDTVIATQHNRETIRKVLSRMTHKTLAGAFDCYAEAVQTVLARRERLARTMARWKKTGLKRAMEAWTEYVEIVRGERAQEAQEVARQSMKDMVDKRAQEAQELARQSMPDVVVRLLRPLARQSVQDMVDLQEQVQRWQEGLDLVAHQSQQAMEEQVRLALHAINRQDEERHELKMELIVAKEVIEVQNQIIEELKHQVQKLVDDAEKKHKAMKELQSMMRGKALLEKQGPPAM
jgi:hypothetical protein